MEKRHLGSIRLCRRGTWLFGWMMYIAQPIQQLLDRGKELKHMPCPGFNGVSTRGTGMSYIYPNHQYLMPV